MERIKSSLKKGLIFLLIPAIIVYLVQFAVSFFDNLWAPLIIFFLGGKLFWGAGFLITAVLSLAIGFILTSRIFQNPTVSKFIYGLWEKIPILNLFFGKEFLLKKDLEKTRAALIEYPSPGLFQIGFVIGTQKIIDADEKEYYKILIPTVPIPATGMLAFTNKIDCEKVKFLKNPTHEVIKLIFSCGFIHIDLKIDDNNNQEN